MAASRVYKATIGKVERLIRASHPSHVVTHVARDLIVVGVASQDDLIDALGRGIKVEAVAHEQSELPNT